MAKQVQWRKGTTAQHTGFVGANCEITVDTTKKTLVVHDGFTPGGSPLVTESNFNLMINQKADADNVVVSVAGKQGVVSLEKSDIDGLENVVNISPEDMPISNAADARFDLIEDELALKVSKDSDTGAAVLPSGNNAARPAVPIEGMIRFNSEATGFEGYFNGQWQSVGGGQMLGNSIVKTVSYNAQIIDEDIVVPEGLNAYSVGNVSIADGKSITISNNSIYKVL